MLPNKKQKKVGTKEPFVERRRFVRIDCLMAGKVVTVSTSEKLAGEISTSLTKNVSAGGLLFKDKKLYAIGQLVMVSVSQGAVRDLDSNLASVIKTQDYVLGRIVRIEEFGGGEFYEYGVCFVRTDEKGPDFFNIFAQLMNRIEFPK